MTMLQQFAMSANGDRWFVENDQATGTSFVLHRANAASGGHETKWSIQDFLELGRGKPEGEALLALLRTSQDDSGVTPLA